MLSPAATCPRPPRSVTIRPFSSEADQIANSPSGETQRGPPAASVAANSRTSGSTGGSSSTIHTPRGYSGHVTPRLESTDEHGFIRVDTKDAGGSGVPFGSTIRATLLGMPRSLHVRLDDASATALEIVRAGELSDSEAVCVALREAAASRRLRSTVRDDM